MDSRFHRDFDDRFHRDSDDRLHRNFDDRFRFGVGFWFYGSPYYYRITAGVHAPDYYSYGPYCSSYDYYYGYCSY